MPGLRIERTSEVQAQQDRSPELPACQKEWGEAMSASKVVVVDDDASVRTGTSRLLRAAGYQVATFATAEEFLESLSLGGEQVPTCLVLDVEMPGCTGLDLQERLLQLRSSVGIVFITGHGDIPMSVRAVKKGAVDFLAKPFDEASLLDAVVQALARSERDHVAHQEIDSIAHRLETLTEREREVLSLVVIGLLNKQIAGHIGTTEKTVKVHRGRVMEKMQVRSLAALVQLCVKVGIPARDSHGAPSPVKLAATRAAL